MSTTRLDYVLRTAQTLFTTIVIMAAAPSAHARTTTSVATSLLF